MAREATNLPFALFPKSVLFVGGDIPPRHKRFTSNGERAHLPPDTNMVGRTTADISGNHTNTLYE